jgi:alanine transaminase
MNSIISHSKTITHYIKHENWLSFQKSFKLFYNNIEVNNFGQKLRFLSTVGVKTEKVGVNENEYFLTLENMNQNVKQLEYAVRGPLVIRANQLEKELSSGAKKPFKQVIRANIGDCHAMGQKPLTFFRQVMSGSLNPTKTISDPNIPEDVKQRIEEILSYCGGQSVGAYSDSAGVEIIRKHCAEYIAERDGIESDFNNIMLTTGASEGVRAVLSIINSKDKLKSGGKHSFTIPSIRH